MPSRIEWYYEPRLLLVTHAGEVCVEDIKDVFSQAYRHWQSLRIAYAL